MSHKPLRFGSWLLPGLFQKSDLFCQNGGFFPGPISSLAASIRAIEPAGACAIRGKTTPTVDTVNSVKGGSFGGKPTIGDLLTFAPVFGRRGGICKNLSKPAICGPIPVLLLAAFCRAKLCIPTPSAKGMSTSLAPENMLEKIGAFAAVLGLGAGLCPLVCWVFVSHLIDPFHLSVMSHHPLCLLYHRSVKSVPPQSDQNLTETCYEPSCVMTVTRIRQRGIDG